MRETLRDREMIKMRKSKCKREGGRETERSREREAERERENSNLEKQSGKGTRVNPFPHNNTFDAPGKQAFCKHCGKRRNCSQGAISSFPTVFSTRLDNFLPFSSNLKLSSANSYSSEESKICHLVMS